MKHLSLLAAATACLAVTTASFAIPTVGAVNETTVLSFVTDQTFGAALTFTGGATGGLQVPTADIQSGNSLTMDRSELEAVRVPSTRFLSGVTKDLEVGLGYEDIKVGGNTDIFASIWNVNAKYAPVTYKGTKLAIGANYNYFNLAGVAGGNIASTNVYAAATRSLGANDKISANATYTFADAREDEYLDSNDLAFGLGYERTFKNGTAAGAELVLSAGNFLGEDTDSINYGNVYVNVPISENLTGRVALSGIGQYTTTDLGLSLSL